jgi:hypothetical protein
MWQEQTLHRHIWIDHVVQKSILYHVVLLGCQEHRVRQSVVGINKSLVVLEIRKHGEARLRQELLIVRLDEPLERIFSKQIIQIRDLEVICGTSALVNLWGVNVHQFSNTIWRDRTPIFGSA